MRAGARVRTTAMVVLRLAVSGDVVSVAVLGRLAESNPTFRS